MPPLPEMVSPEDTDRFVGVRRGTDGKMRSVRMSWLSILRAIDESAVIQRLRDAIGEVAKMPGPSGADAYQVAVASGFNGTRAEWLASLRALPGLSAYEVARANGFTGSIPEWLASLVGAAAKPTTIKAGTITMLANGAPPTIGNSGTAQNVVLDFGLPAAKDGTNGKDASTLLGPVIVAETAVLAILSGIRRVSIPVPSSYGVKAGQALLLVPDSIPSAQYATHDVYASGANTINVGVTVPALALGANYSIPCKLHRLTT